MKFTFQNSTKIIFGEGRIKALSREIPKDCKVLVTYGGGSIIKNGVYDQVLEALKDHEWGEFGGIEPNPQYDTLMEAVDKIRQDGFDYLLAVGGGSVIDGTKFIAAAARYQGDEAWDLLNGESVRDAIPLACVLTLPATGSESNDGAVISRGASKLFFNSPLVQPEFAVLDPATTLSLSKRQIANGIADAFSHVLEQYLTYPQYAKVQDRFAEGLLLTLIEEGPKAMETPDDLAVRANIMWAATLSLNGLIGVGVRQDWATHLIGHELTALHGIDHGRSLTIITPAMMRHCRQAKREKLLQYAERVFGITEGDDERMIDEAIERTVDFFKRMGLPTSLGDVDLDDGIIDAVIDNLERHGRLKMGEHGDIDLEQSRSILRAAL